MEKLLAYCGINCDECPARIATVENDDALRQKTAEEWYKLYANILESFGIHSLKPEDINCCGCRSEQGNLSHAQPARLKSAARKGTSANVQAAMNMSRVICLKTFSPLPTTKMPRRISIRYE
jgi:Protein of unknown function (DUF3795)